MFKFCSPALNLLISKFIDVNIYEDNASDKQIKRCFYTYLVLLGIDF